MNSATAKTLSMETIRDALLDEQFPTKPLDHQARTIAWAADAAGQRLALWHDIGTGKSLTSLYINQWWGFRRLLIICPNSVTEGWAEQLTLHAPWPFRLLVGPQLERQEALRDSMPVFVVNYEGLKLLFGKQRKRGKRSRWEMLPLRIREANIDAVIFDECQHLASHKATQTMIAHELSRCAHQAIIMTGTPVSKNEADLHSQYDVLDQGRTLGTRWRYFAENFTQHPYGRNTKRFAWELRDGAQERILDRVAGVTLRFDREECGDLPEKLYETHHCDMTAEQLALTTSIIDGKPIKLREGTLATVDKMQIGNKLSQVAGGLLILSNGKVHRLKKNPKLDLLIKNLPSSTRKVIVYHSFIEEGHMIEERLTKAGINHAAQRGERHEVGRFMKDPACRVLVAHPKSGGVGLNLQVADMEIFYNNGTSGAAVRAQAEGRIWRLGQRNRCLFVDYVVRGSIDEARLDRTRTQAQTLQRIMEYVRNYRTGKETT